jgi:hypothetical protein
MLKKTLLTALVFIGTMMSLSASAITLCDNFAKTWDLDITGDSLVGIRDTTDSLGCGGTYTRGMFASTGLGTQHFVLTSMEGNGGCVAVIWDGTWSGSSGSGTWYNQNGAGSGSFTLTSGACASGGDGTDPAN